MNRLSFARNELSFAKNKRQDPSLLPLYYRDDDTVSHASSSSLFQEQPNPRRIATYLLAAEVGERK